MGKLETPHLWKEHIVCKACRNLLSETESDSESEPDAAMMQELLKHEPLTDEELAAEQRAHFNYRKPPADLTSRTLPKSKLVAGLLALFLGALGIHNFYLGFKGRGIIQLVLTLTVYGAIVSALWAFVEMLAIFAGADPRDAENRPLVG
jgi:hypothetical protein